MALDWGPDRTVRTPGAMLSDESSEVANVRVTKGKLAFLLMSGLCGGRYGSKNGRSDAGNTKTSLDILDVFLGGRLPARD